MSKILQDFFSSHYPGMSICDACQTILDELNDIETCTGADTGTLQSLIETILDDANQIQYDDTDANGEY